MTLIMHYLFQSYLHLNRGTWSNNHVMCPVKPREELFCGVWYLPPIKSHCEVSAQFIYAWSWHWSLNMGWLETPTVKVWIYTKKCQKQAENKKFFLLLFLLLFLFLSLSLPSYFLWPSMCRNVFSHFLHKITQSSFTLQLEVVKCLSEMFSKPRRTITS